MMNIEKIWQEYKLALKAFIRSKIANEADVDDLLQEIMLKTFKHLTTVQKPQSIKSWLFQVANHTIIDFYRKSSESQGQYEYVSQVGNLEEQTDEVRKQLSRCIMPFIDALPDKQAALLKAIELNKQSQKDYAKAHGIPYSTLKSQVQKSRYMLKQVFDDCCYYERDKFGRIVEYVNKG